MTHIHAIEACHVSPVSFTWEGEEKAKQEFFTMVANKRKEMEEMQMSDMEMEMIEAVSVVSRHDVVEHDMDETGEETGEEYNPIDENRRNVTGGFMILDPAYAEKIGLSAKEKERYSAKQEEGTGEEYNPFDEVNEEDKEEGTEELDMSKGENDPLDPYADELVNICFKGYGGVQIDFAQRLGRDAHKAVDVLFAQQKGKFALTIQRIVEGEGGTEYVDIMTKHPAVGQKSKIKGASAGKGAKGKTPEQLAEIERKRKEAEEERKRKEAEKAAKAELRAKEKAAEELQAAMKAARNAPDEFHKDGSANKSYLVFEMLHRPQGATYHELGAATDTVNGGWKTTIRKFAATYNKAVLTMYRTCEAKGGIKPYAAYKLIDNNGEALGSIPNGWVIDPSV